MKSLGYADYLTAVNAYPVLGVDPVFYWVALALLTYNISFEGDKACETDKKIKCKLHNQNKIASPQGKIRCTYLCPLDSGGTGFVTRILNGDSCPSEFDANSVPGDQGF